MGATRLASGKDAAIIYRVPFSTPTRDASPPLVVAFGLTSSMRHPIKRRYSLIFNTRYSITQKMMKSGVFDNRIETVLPCRNKIMRFILEKM